MPAAAALTPSSIKSSLFWMSFAHTYEELLPFQGQGQGQHSCEGQGQGQGQGWDEREEVAICRREMGLAMDLHGLPARAFSSPALISTFYYYTTFGRLDTGSPLFHYPQRACDSKGSPV